MASAAEVLGFDRHQTDFAGPVGSFLQLPHPSLRTARHLVHLAFAFGLRQSQLCIDLGPVDLAIFWSAIYLRYRP